MELSLTVTAKAPQSVLRFENTSPGGDRSLFVDDVAVFGGTDTPQQKGRCWEAQTSQFPHCSGYVAAGYTCLGEWCAALDPGGDPSECARALPPGYVIPSDT